MLSQESGEVPDCSETESLFFGCDPSPWKLPGSEDGSGPGPPVLRPSVGLEASQGAEGWDLRLEARPSDTGRNMVFRGANRMRREPATGHWCSPVYSDGRKCRYTPSRSLAVVQPPWA